MDQAIVSGGFTMVLIGRLFGPKEFGLYMLGFSVLVLAPLQESLIALPYTVYVQRLLSEDRGVYLGSALFQVALLTSAVMLLLAIVCLLAISGIGPAGLAVVMSVLLVVMPVVLLREFARRLAFAHLQVKTALLLDILTVGLQLTGLITLAALHRLTAATAYAVLGAACAITVTLWLTLWRRRFHFERARFGADLKTNWLFGRWVAAAQMTSQISGAALQWLIALWLGAADTGVFAAAVTMVMLCNPLLLAVGNLLTPKAGADSYTRRDGWLAPAGRPRHHACGQRHWCFCIRSGDVWRVFFDADLRQPLCERGTSGCLGSR